MQGSPNGYQPKKVTVTLSSYDELEEASRKKQLEEQKNSRQNNRFWP